MSLLTKSKEKNDNNEEIEIIMNLMEDIFQYEKKIQEVNNLLNNNNINISQIYSKISELKHQKLKLNEKLSEIEQNFSEISKNRDTQLKLNESMRNKIENQIQEYKYKLNTLSSLTFNPIISQKIFPNNDNKSEVLTNEQINNILFDSKNIKNINEYQPDNITNEIINMNKRQEKDLSENINNIKLKINQTDEILKMLKEEKDSTTNQLINIISCKESIDALIKFNHYLIKNYIKEKNENTESNEIINDEEIYNKNKWEEPIHLFFYEICSLDSEQFSKGFNDIIIDIFDINNMPIYKNQKNNLELSEMTSRKKGNNNLNRDINSFSISKILKKEFEFFVKINKNNNLINNESIAKNFLEKISNIVINKLKLIVNKKNNSEKFAEINKNIIIYLAYYVKSLFYGKIINSSVKFIKKEYKSNKKEIKNINNELIVEVKKLELKQRDIHHQINKNELEIKIIQKEYHKKQIIDNLKNENTSHLSKNEQEYLQICSNINNLLLQKEEIKSLNEKINSEFNIKNEEINKDKSKLNNEIADIDKEIKALEEELELKKVKSNEKIIEYREIISDKYNKIKSQLNIYKIKYGENTEQYNSLINDINEKIKNKDNMDNINLKDLEIKSNNNSENIYKFSINSYSYEDDEKNNYNRNINSNTNINSYNSNNEENYYNLEFSTNRFSNNKNYINKNANNNPIGLLKANKERKIINAYSSNKLQKHINYIDKYFNTNSNKGSNNSNNEEKINNYNNIQKSNFKSSTQLNYYYPSFRPISNLPNSSSKKNYINNNFYNTHFSYQNKSTRITSLLDKYSKNIPYYDINQSQNRNEINSFKTTNRTLHSFRKENLPFDNNINIREKLNMYYKKSSRSDNELSKTISELKNNIIKNEKLPFDLLEKIKILTKITFCFFRKIDKDKNSTKYNPINKISNESLSKAPYYFLKSSISLNKSYNSIRIGISNQLDPIDIYIKNIEYTIVSSSMKKMIEIYRDYRKYCKKGKEKSDKESFIEKEMEKYNNINSEYINNCIGNKKFSFILYVEENTQMEFLFFSYDDFKIWINGLAFIIKNKKKLLDYIGEN